MSSLLLFRNTIHFNYEDYLCDYDMSSSSVPLWYKWYSAVIPGFVATLTYIILVVTSVLLLVVAKKAASRHGGSLRGEGLITVLLTVAVMLISYVPVTIATAIWMLDVNHDTTTVWRVAHCLQYLNVMSNFFVYALTVRSFRFFLKQKSNQFISLLRFFPQRRHRNRVNISQASLPRQGLPDSGRQGLPDSRRQGLPIS